MHARTWISSGNTTNTTNRKLGIAAVALAAARVVWDVALHRRRRAVHLRNATALVCGASRGLGRAIALELAHRGVRKIAICARTERDLDDVADELARLGVHVCAETCDLSRSEETERFIANACARLGPIDILITNAATITVAPLATLTKEDFDEAFESIFYTALNPILALSAAMRRRHKGTIAVVTSIGARIGVPHLASYCAAKFATLGVAESFRAELAQDGVHVLTIVPGLMRTGSHIHAELKGDYEREYAWFGASALAPILSIDADRAARRIVSGIAKGAVEVSFTPEARLAPIVRSLAPGFFADMMMLLARLLLPPAPDRFPRASEKREGVDIERSSDSRIVQAVKRRGRRSTARHSQV